MTAVEEQYEAFAELARRYCAAVEDTSAAGDQYMRLLNDLLLRLLPAAMNLPEVEADGVHDSIGFETWSRTKEQLADRLPIDLYWDTFHPLETPADEVVAGSLSDDLADTWRDLKSGLVELDARGGSARAAVWWQWRFNFHCHWGEHATCAIRVMYHALRDS